jgi:DNA-binding transcriptional regulator YhcF (GntR family)
MIPISQMREIMRKLRRELMRELMRELIMRMKSQWYNTSQANRIMMKRTSEDLRENDNSPPE